MSVAQIAAGSSLRSPVSKLLYNGKVGPENEKLRFTIQQIFSLASNTLHIG